VVSSHLRIPEEGVDVVGAAAGAVGRAAADARRPLAADGGAEPALAQREHGRVQQVAHRDLREVRQKVLERHPDEFKRVDWLSRKKDSEILERIRNDELGIVLLAANADSISRIK